MICLFAFNSHLLKFFGLKQSKTEVKNMVSLKRYMKFFCTVISSFFLFSAWLSAQTLDKPITECSGSSESRIMCTRDLPDGTKQEAGGWCRCVRGMYQGGCNLPAYTYTDIQILKTGQQCRECTVPSVAKGCSTLTAQIVDETPSCGEWYSCGGTPIVKECTSGQVEYMPIEPCETSERKCCSDGKWSGWGEECSSSGASSGSSSGTWGISSKNALYFSDSVDNYSATDISGTSCSPVGSTKTLCIDIGRDGLCLDTEYSCED